MNWERHFEHAAAGDVYVFLGVVILLWGVHIILWWTLVIPKKTDTKGSLAWLFAFLSLPVISVLIFFCLSPKMDGSRFNDPKLMKYMERQANRQAELLQISAKQKCPQTERDISPGEVSQEHFKEQHLFYEYRELILFNLRSLHAFYSDDNILDIFTDGNGHFDALCEDINRATSFVHLEFYIIRDDVLFARIRQLLVNKAREGVRICILYDAMGSQRVKKHVWESLEKEGIRTISFFPKRHGIFQIHPNHRNHRKIVTIDNQIAYVGGFNVGREYLGMDGKIGNWRDTQLRIQGRGAIGLEVRFLQDWEASGGEIDAADTHVSQYRIPFEKCRETQKLCGVQIIHSGPDYAVKAIRDTYIKLIACAKERVCIQTPYFVPDEAFLSVVLICVRSGVEVNLMIPGRGDHPFVYWATYFYMGELLLAGANCYTYDAGFLHSKGIVVDGKVFCYGTANLDVRSFSLNFEVNAVVYDENKAVEMEQIFRRDLQNCTKITKEQYLSRGRRVKLKEQISRLLGPVL